MNENFWTAKPISANIFAWLFVLLFNLWLFGKEIIVLSYFSAFVPVYLLRKWIYVREILLFTSWLMIGHDWLLLCESIWIYSIWNYTISLRWHSSWAYWRQLCAITRVKFISCLVNIVKAIDGKPIIVRNNIQTCWLCFVCGCPKVETPITIFFTGIELNNWGRGQFLFRRYLKHNYNWAVALIPFLREEGEHCFRDEET